MFLDKVLSTVANWAVVDQIIFFGVGRDLLGVLQSIFLFTKYLLKMVNAKIISKYDLLFLQVGNPSSDLINSCFISLHRSSRISLPSFLISKPSNT